MLSHRRPRSHRYHGDEARYRYNEPSPLHRSLPAGILHRKYIPSTETGSRP
jgi:hypothetical protein